jgi:hypothetical protein
LGGRNGRSNGRKGRGGFALLALPRLFVALALTAVLNLALAPIARAAHVVPRDQAASVGEIAADLQATFGPGFQLCVNVDDEGPSTPPTHHHDDGCPLCCPHAAALLAAPEPSALPGRTAFAFVTPPSSGAFAPPPPARASPAQPRAPPLN